MSQDQLSIFNPNNLSAPNLCWYLILMNRAWRVDYEGASCHLFSRGNECNDIFADDYDRKSFLDAIEEMSERFEIHVFAYVLMSIHYHVLF